MLPLLLIAISPVAWFVVLHNHTYIHSRFTYRIWVVGLTALLAVFIKVLEGDRQRFRWQRIPAAMIVPVTIIVALNIKTTTFIHNGTYVPEQLKLEEDVEVIQKFSPTYSVITAFNFLLYADAGQNGKIGIQLWEDDKIIWETSLSLEEGIEGKFYELPIELQLKTGEVYEIRIRGSNLENAQVAVGVTDSGVHPMQELTALQVGKKAYDSQLIFGVLYRHRIGGRTLVLAVELQVLLYWGLYLTGEIRLRRRIRKYVFAFQNRNERNDENERKSR